MQKYTLKRQLLLCFVLGALIPAIIAVSFYFVSVQAQTTEWMAQQERQGLEHALELVEYQTTQMEDLFYWIQNNETLNNMLNQEDGQQYSQEHYLFKNQIQEEFYRRMISQYILSLFIVGENGLDVRMGVEAPLIDRMELIAQTASRTDDTNWGALSSNLCSFSNHRRVVLYVRDLTSSAGDQEKGRVIALLSPAVFNDVIGAADLNDKQVLLRNAEGDILSVQGVMQEGRKMQYNVQSAATSWSLEAHVSTELLQMQQKSAWVIGSMLVGIVLLVIVVSSILLTDRFIQPLQTVIENVDRLSEGDFEHSQKVGGAYEIMRLNRHILDMGISLQKLMQEKIVQERERKKVELNVLQTQMNPHFLYNTLNSMRLMAGMQGKSGIASMLEKLGKLLRANLAVEGMEIPLSTELELLDSYVYIQNIRMNGKIRYTREGVPVELMSQQIAKFTLQPIVENAILHGMNGKDGKCDLQISGWEQGRFVYLSVRDTGKGMQAEQVDQLLQCLYSKQNTSGKEEGGNGIALSNVLQRLQLYFGPSCGLKIESEWGKGTVVTLWIPRKGDLDVPGANS